MTVFNLPSMPQLRVLVIEDNDSDYLLLLDHFRENQVNLETCRVDNEQALIEALAQPWDIILADYALPHFNGLRALKIVRELSPETPFVCVSGTIGEATAVKIIKAGADNYVMKTDLGRLIPTIERELSDAYARRQQQQAQSMLQRLSLAIKQSSDSVFICDAQGLIEYANPAFAAMTGYSLSDVQGQQACKLYEDETGVNPFDHVWQTISRGHTFRGEIKRQRKDGTEFLEEAVISPLHDDHGEITHYVFTGRDVTEKAIAENSRNRLQSVLESSLDMVSIVRPDGTLLYLNRSGCNMLRLEDNALQEGTVLWDVLPAHLSKQMQGKIFPEAFDRGYWTGEVWLREDTDSQPGLPISLVVLAHTEKHMAVPYLSLIGRDISERKQFEQQLHYQATHDSLTDLPNRYFLLDRLQAAIHSAKRHQNSLAVLLMDIDKFKRINDSLGHIAGDELLVQTAKRLQGCLRPTDTVARLGGDEFIILLEDIAHPKDVIVVINKIFQVFKLPLIIEAQELFITLSVGVAIYPQEGETESDLMRHADVAMYRAKQNGADNQYQFYTADMDERGQELLQMDTDLRYALANNELRVFYQPQIDINTQRLVGVEALLRWQSRTRGLVSPIDFIPLLESSGLIVKVGEWVLQQACAQYQQFCAAGQPHIRISVNISAVQLQDVNFKEKIANTVQRHALPADILELEITENIVMLDPERTADMLLALQAVGVRSAIDDFGTGYSSLAYLKRFPVHVLKIDRSFLRDVMHDASDATIVEASISMAHKLGLQVIAEGVETEQQLTLLRNLQCDIAQGFYYSKPVPAEELMQHWLPANTPN